MIVTVSAEEILFAGNVGLRRRACSIHQGRKQYGNDDAFFDADVMGAVAEYVVARELNLFWTGATGKTDKADVGNFVDVRMRRVPGSGIDLAIRPKDPDTRPVVQVFGIRANGSIEFDLNGWLYGGEAKQRGRERGEWCEAKGVWYVPPPYRPIATLIDLCRHPHAERAA